MSEKQKNIFFSKQKIFFICITVLAVVSIVVGLCFIFFGNKTIKAVPNSLEVKKIDGDYYVVSEFNGQYSYQFKLEQYIDEGYMTVGLVDSKSNTIKLEDANLNVIAGASYRFSVRYTNENGGGKSKFSEALTWSPTWALDGVDYQKVTFENDMLSWEKVPDADEYVVTVVDENLSEQEIPCGETFYDLSEFGPGRYTVFVIARCDDSFVEDSEAGVGKKVVIERKNILSNAQMLNGELSVRSTYNVLKFEVFVDGELVGKLDVNRKVGSRYVFENVSTLFDGLDLNGCEVSLRSVKNDCVLQSEKITIVMA